MTSWGTALTVLAAAVLLVSGIEDLRAHGD